MKYVQWTGRMNMFNRNAMSSTEYCDRYWTMKSQNIKFSIKGNFW